jgi:hypothetical protein
LSKKLPQETHYTKVEIRNIIRSLKNEEWFELPSKWTDKDGGGGEYIQHDHFHVKVNPQKIGDLGSYELKTHRSKSSSLVTLGSLDPKDDEKHSLLLPLLLEYGYPYKEGNISEYRCRDRRAGKVCKHAKYNYLNGLCYPPDELALGVDICGKDVIGFPQNRWGFHLEVNRDDKRIFMHFDHNRTSKQEKYQNWLNTIKARNGELRDLDRKYSLSFDEVERRAKGKFRNMVFIKYLEKKENDKKYIKIEEAYFLEDFDFIKFLSALETGEVMYELRLHGNKVRISKNHGTGFRMFERNFPAIYSRKESIV